MSIAAKLQFKIPSSTKPEETTVSQPLLDKKDYAIHNEISFQHKPIERSSLETSKPQARYPRHSKLEENVIKFYPCPSPQYQPNKSPPDLNEALRHKEAHKISPFSAPKHAEEVCESTGLRITKKRLKLGCNKSELFYLGPSIPAYLLFVKQAILIFGGIVAVVLFFSFQGSSSILFGYEEGFSQDLSITSPLILGMNVIIFLLFLVLHLFRKKQKLTKLACKKTLVTPSDYTIMCSDMGRIHVEEEIRKFFSDYIVPGYSLDVVKVVITYNIEKHVDEIRKMHKALQNQKEVDTIIDEQARENEKERLEKEIERCNKYFEDHKKKLASCFGLKRNGLCFITFNTKQEAKTVRRKFEMSKFESFSIQLLQAMTEDYQQFFFKQHFVTVQKAPELHEIIWENLNCNASNKLFMAVSLGSVLLVVLMTFIGLYGCKSLASSISPYLLGLIIFATNEILEYIIPLLNSFDRFKTTTELNIATGIRITIAQCFNMIVPIWIINIISFNVPFGELSKDLHVIAIVTFFLPLIVRFINPQHLLRVKQRNVILEQETECELTQEEANAIFEDPEIHIPTLYSHMIRILLFCCLYVAISPGIGVIGFVAGFATYWVEKNNILRKSCLPSSMRSEVSEAMFEFLDVTTLLLAIGNFLLIYITPLDANGGTSAIDLLFISSIIVVTISGVYAVMPNKRLNRTWFPRKEIPQLTWVDELFYQQASDYFLQSYSTANPVYRDKEVAKNIREIYSATNEAFKCVRILESIPEVLPIFEYATRRPSLHEIWRKKLTGVQNPYYSFPQNYGFGQLYLDNILARPSRSQGYKSSNNDKRSRSDQKSQNPTVIEMQVREPSKKSLSENKEVTEVEEKQSEIPSFEMKMSDNRGRLDTMTLNTPPGASILKEWSVFFNQQAKSGGLTENTTPRETLNLPQGAMVYESFPDSRPSISSQPKSPSLNCTNIHLSPIRKYTIPKSSNAIMSSPFTLN